MVFRKVNANRLLRKKILINLTGSSFDVGVADPSIGSVTKAATRRLCLSTSTPAS